MGFSESPLTSFGIQWKLFEIPGTSIGDPVKSFVTHRSPWKYLIKFLSNPVYFNGNPLEFAENFMDSKESWKTQENILKYSIESLLYLFEFQ